MPPFSHASGFISSIFPVTVNTTRSQMLVTRSAVRSRLWAAHSQLIGLVDVLWIGHGVGREFPVDLFVQSVDFIIFGRNRRGKLDVPTHKGLQRLM